MAVAQMKHGALLYLAFLTLLAGVHLWLVATGRPRDSQPQLLYTLRGHEGPITNLAFSPDGRLLATSSEDRTAKLWELRSGRLEHTLKGHAGTVGSVAFAPDGRTLATGGADGTVKLWDVASGRLLRTVPDGGYPATFSPNGRLLAAAAGNEVRLWNVHSRRVAATLRGSDFPPGGPSLGCQVAIGQLAFAPDGKRLAAVESVFCGNTPGLPEDFVRLWDVATGRFRRTLTDPPTERKHIAFAPDDRQLVVGGGWIVDGDLLLWDTVTGRVRSLGSGQEHGSSSIAYDPRGRWLALGSADGVAFVSASSGSQVFFLKAEGLASGIDQEIAVSPDGSLLGAARADGDVEVWRLPASLQGGKVLARAPVPAALRDARALPKAPRPGTRQSILAPASPGTAASNRG